MTGMTLSGTATEVHHPRPRAKDQYRGLLPEPTALGLRAKYHAGLKAAGFSSEQIAQITGWGSRTIRRDLAQTTPEATIEERLGSEAVREDAPPAIGGGFEVGAGDRGPLPGVEGESPPVGHGDPGGLTIREARALVDEYGRSTDPAVRDFLASLSS